MHMYADHMSTRMVHVNVIHVLTSILCTRRTWSVDVFVESLHGAVGHSRGADGVRPSAAPAAAVAEGGRIFM